MIKYKLNSSEAKPPYKATEFSAGYDLTAISEHTVETEGYGFIEYDTGVSFEIPEGIVGILVPRSSISKTGLIMANSVGIIDPDYRGTVKFRFKHIPGTLKYKSDERCGQILFVPTVNLDLVQVEKLGESHRNKGGFGSTGL